MSFKNDKILFGPAGNSASFYAEGYKGTKEAPPWLKARGLTCFEYSFGRGVNLRAATAEEIRVAFEKEDVKISAHAPYYINLAGTDAEATEKSYGYILSALKALLAMGGKRVVFHAAGCGKMARDEAFKLTKNNLAAVMERLEGEGLGEFILCPETMGKHNQIGNVSETLELCNLSPRLVPCFDFGHINSYGGGCLKTAADFAAIFDESERVIGAEKTANAHIHFSKIQYGAAGEIRHLDFTDTVYGPDFEPLAAVLKGRGYTPTVICESKECMAEDAVVMCGMYERA